MKKKIAIFGGGPASMALASFLDPDLFQVIIYEQNKTCGRKFLVAGKGGFNLTYDEPIDLLIKRYIPIPFLNNALNTFTNTDFRHWLARIGIDTFVGSSNRVFPIKGIKPIQILDAIIKYIESRGVDIKYQMKWEGWSAAGLPIVNGGVEIVSDYYIYAFGGTSWKVTGSTGAWASHFKSKGIGLNDFEASNCAFKIDWPEQFIASVEGKPLKNIAVTCDGKTQKGELVITRFGLEGNGIYALSHNIRKQLYEKGVANVFLDFKPMFSEEDINAKLANSKSPNLTSFLKKDLKLSPVQIQMIKTLSTKEDFVDRGKLVDLIKKLSVSIEGLAPIDEAISTVGGIRVGELSGDFELKKMKGSFCIGEMVDWDVPTGGYLLQGCFSMGAFLAGRFNGLMVDG